MFILKLVKHLLLDQIRVIMPRICVHTCRSIRILRGREREGCYLIINNFIFNYAVVYFLWKFEYFVILYKSCFNTEMAQFGTLIKEQSKFLRQVI